MLAKVAREVNTVARIKGDNKLKLSTYRMVFPDYFLTSLIMLNTRPH
jgi:hypothetical protein